MAHVPKGRQGGGGWLFIGLAAVATVPALLTYTSAIAPPVEIETLLYGIAILGSSFLVSWGAEVAQLDISQALAIVFLAFIAVLPEYAVDLTFAFKAGRQDAGGHALAQLCGVEHPCRSLAVANMTGANRLLIGVGWAAVVLVWWLRSGNKKVRLHDEHRGEVGYLVMATMWAFVIAIRGQIGLLDVGVLLTMFVAYLWRAAKQESDEPELIGPPIVIAALGVVRRRIVTILIFIFAAGMILIAAEPFSEGLVHTGEKLGASPFLLVQWLAPLASEAPEMIIAILFVLRGKPGAGLGTLVSSKVNQWTLLIATLPLVYALARGGLHPMLLDGRQVEEIVLTASQSAFALAVLANMVISRLEAVGLMVLFLAQFGFRSTASRYGFSIAYGVLLAIIFVTDGKARRGLKAALAEALTPPWRSPSPAEKRR
ncbi:MAG: sodium:calcium antiporter [Actinomycetota bacterium]